MNRHLCRTIRGVSRIVCMISTKMASIVGRKILGSVVHQSIFVEQKFY